MSGSLEYLSAKLAALLIIRHSIGTPLIPWQTPNCPLAASKLCCLCLLTSSNGLFWYSIPQRSAIPSSVRCRCWKVLKSTKDDFQKLFTLPACHLCQVCKVRPFSGGGHRIRFSSGCSCITSQSPIYFFSAYSYSFYSLFFSLLAHTIPTFQRCS